MASDPSPQGVGGIGTDIIEIRRIKEAIERHGDRFVDRLFTERERHYCQKHRDPTPRFAGRFAAKEAILKALGKGFKPEVQWQEIEVLNDPHGKPEVHLSTRLKEIFPLTHLFVSISHCEEYATATAILTGVIHATP
ncbi:MAG: Holo-[acyl-carrier-protein] synthase [Chlamydiales bacterium]|nr:Holo-[acyl-carrier-protein] synthase [Chlamydiales bacterium]